MENGLRSIIVGMSEFQLTYTLWTTLKKLAPLVKVNKYCFFHSLSAEKRYVPCTIDSGKAILLPTLSAIAWTDKRDETEVWGYPAPDSVITEYVKSLNEIGDITAILDNRMLFSGDTKKLEYLRALSPFFDLTFPDNSVFQQNAIPGVWRTQVDGYFVFLEPLPPGNHTLYTKVSVDPTKLPMDTRQTPYSAVLTYNLIVKP